MDTTPIKRYKAVEAFVNNYCDEHNFTDEERQFAEQAFLEPARRAIAQILVSDLLSPYLNKLASLLPDGNPYEGKRVINQVHVHGKTVFVNE